VSKLDTRAKGTAAHSSFFLGHSKSIVTCGLYSVPQLPSSLSIGSSSTHRAFSMARWTWSLYWPNTLNTAHTVQNTTKLFLILSLSLSLLSLLSLCLGLWSSTGRRAAVTSHFRPTHHDSAKGLYFKAFLLWLTSTFLQLRDFLDLFISGFMVGFPCTKQRGSRNCRKTKRKTG
jgi:hypothetical protein